MRYSMGADVIPAKAGIQICRLNWMPACAGMTAFPPFTDPLRVDPLFY
jgi:hypothetical protein